MANTNGKAEMQRLQEELDTFKAYAGSFNRERQESANALNEAIDERKKLANRLLEEKEKGLALERMRDALWDSERHVRLLTGDVKIQQERINYLEGKFDEMKALVQEAKAGAVYSRSRLRFPIGKIE